MKKPRDPGGDMGYQEGLGSSLAHTWLTPVLWVDQIR